MERASAVALITNAAMPAFTTYKYAQYAHAPGRFDDAHAEALAALFIAQLPLCILGAVFAGVGYIEGPAWRRVAAYAVVVALVAVVGGFAKLALDTAMGPILGWAIAMQLVIIAVAGPRPDLARKRIDAVANDAVNLFVLAVLAILLAALAATLLLVYTRGPDGVSRIAFEWSDVAWIVAAYFALRTWSAVYPFTAAFETRGKGYFERPWIDWLIRCLGRPRKYGDS